MADSNVNLDARERTGRGKNDARRLRAQGMVPAVLYGDGNGSSVLAVPEKVVDYTLQHVGDNALYDLSIGDGANATARVVDAQRNPLTGRLVHVDFAPVNMRERIVVTVPVAVVGESPGVNEGGVLQQEAFEVEVETLPGDIPQELEIDVSGLDVNENLSIGDIRLPEGVTLVSEPEEVAVTVTTPTEVTEEDLEAAGIVEEPSDDETAEGVQPDAEEGTAQVSPENGEGPAGQNLQA